MSKRHKDDQGDVAELDREQEAREKQLERQEQEARDIEEQRARELAEREASRNVEELNRQIGGVSAEAMRRDPNLTKASAQDAYERHKRMADELAAKGRELDFSLEFSQFGMRILLLDHQTGRVHVVSQPHLRGTGQVAIARPVDEVVAEIVNDRVHFRTTHA